LEVKHAIFVIGRLESRSNQFQCFAKVVFVAQKMPVVIIDPLKSISGFAKVVFLCLNISPGFFEAVAT